MNILVLHRLPYHKMEYHRGIDHTVHEVTYAGTQERLSNIPYNLPCKKITLSELKPLEEEIMELLKNFKKIDRIIALSEYELLAAAKIRKSFNIPGAIIANVEKVRDKILMKQCIEKQGITVPKFRNLLDVIDKKLIFLWGGKTVLKPIDGACSENVKIFTSLSEILKRVNEKNTGIEVLDNHTVSPEHFEVEQFIDGPILHIDGLVNNGEMKICLASEYLGTCLEYAKGNPLGSIQIDTTEEIEAWTKKCLLAVDIHEGCFHLEAISTKDGLIFLEVANRVGGADVIKTFELATGIHLPSAELALSINNQYSIDFNMRTSEKFGWFIFPGHHLKSTHCQIKGSKLLENNSMMIESFKLNSRTACKKQITYQATEVPLAGIIKAIDTDTLRIFMHDIFSNISVIEKFNVLSMK